MAKSRKIKKKPIPKKQGRKNLFSLEREYYSVTRRLVNLLVPEELEVNPTDLMVRITRVGIRPDDPRFGHIVLAGHTIFGIFEADGEAGPEEMSSLISGILTSMAELHSPSNLNRDLYYKDIFMVLCENEPSCEEREYAFMTKDQYLEIPTVFTPAEFDEIDNLLQVHEEYQDEPTFKFLIINEETDPDAFKLFKSTKSILKKMPDTTRDRFSYFDDF